MAVKRTIRDSYIDLRGIHLGVEFIRNNNLQPKQSYSFSIEGLESEEAEGTLDKSGFIGGLSLMYRNFDLADGDEIEIELQDGVIYISPPAGKRKELTTTTTTTTTSDADGNYCQPFIFSTVFARQTLKHLFIEPFAFGNLSRWIPQTEADVYMVFGVLSEYTDYRYCCGASKALLTKLGYQACTKPDAVLIDRTTDEYLMAEFKMSSKDFVLNHQKDDVDVLVCWEDNVTDRSRLPKQVVGLRKLLETGIRKGELEL